MMDECASCANTNCKEKRPNISWCIKKGIYKRGYNQALEDMLTLSQEWEDNHESFLDFQRFLRNRLD